MSVFGATLTGVLIIALLAPHLALREGEKCRGCPIFVSQSPEICLVRIACSPGSFTPPDRFVRMFLLKQMAHAHSRPAEMLDGIAAVTGLLNNVHLIRGTISSPSLSGVPILECE